MEKANMTREDAIAYDKEQLDVFGGEHAEFIKLAVEALKQEPCEDVMTIHTQGLDEEIRCTMCTNSMKSDRGCDGGCMIDKDMYEKVMDIIRNRIVSSTTPTRKKGKWIPRKAKYDNAVPVYECSICHKNNGFDDDNFCPNCGVEMEKVRTSK